MSLSVHEEKALVSAAPLHNIQSFIDRIVDGEDPNIYQELLVFLNLNERALDTKSDEAFLDLQQKIYDALDEAEGGGIKSAGQKTVLRNLLITGPELRRCLNVIFEQGLRRIFEGGRSFGSHSEDSAYRAAAVELVKILEAGGNSDEMRHEVLTIMSRCKRDIVDTRAAVSADLLSAAGHPGIHPGQDVDVRGTVCAEGRAIFSGISELKTTDGESFADLTPEEEAGLEKFLAGMPKLDVKL